MSRRGVIIILTLATFLLAWYGGFERKANAQALFGTWRAQVRTAFGICTSETVLMPDGQFSKTCRCGALLTWDRGTYAVGQGFVHFNIVDHQPKVYNGKRMTWPNSETVFFEMAGPNQMICHDRITGGSWQAVRVR